MAATSNIKNAAFLVKPFWHQVTEAQIDNPNLDDLEIAKPFTLADLYNCDPCKNQFLKFLQEVNIQTLYNFKIRDIFNSPTMQSNLPWLVKHGFLQEKEKEIEFEAGKYYIDKNNDVYFYTKEQLVNLTSGNITEIKYMKKYYMEQLKFKTIPKEEVCL